MKTRTLFTLLAALAIAGAAAYGTYRLGMNRGMQMAAPAGSAPVETADANASAPATDRKVLYWHDPMVPGQKFDKPGKSPFMDMQLVPVYAGAADDPGTVSVSPRIQQNLGVRTAEVIAGVLTPSLQAVGNVAFNERDLTLVQARANGYVEKLFVKAPLDAVRKGQALAELYIPDWVAAQEEYLTVKRMSAAGLEGLLDGARQRMRLAGMSDEQIRLVESTGKVHARLTVIAPSSGVIAELTAREGMTIAAGAPLFRINGLSSVWVNAEVSESEAGLVRPGTPVEARAAAVPGAVFKGRVSALLPEVDRATRTLKARIELANPGGRLVPGMFATVEFAPAARAAVLLVPTEAVIQTGKRTLVIVVQGDSGFAPVEVQTGLEANGQTEIRKGLASGQKVVVSGQFLIDSEASLKGVLARLGTDSNAAKTNAATPPAGANAGRGKVNEVNLREGRVDLSHGPIPSMKWPAMTMGFRVLNKSELAGLKAGDEVDFELRSEAVDGDYVITRIERARGAAK